MTPRKIIVIGIIFATALIVVLGWQPSTAAIRKVVNQLRLASALNDGLVGYWSFDGSDMNWGNSSVEATDVSGQGRNGDVTNFGQSSVVAGIAGQALRFDGVDDYVELGDNFTGIVTTTGTYSMSVWLRAGDITLYKGIVNISPGASSSDRNGISISEGALQGGYYNGVSYVGNSQSIAANTWYHAVLVNTAGTVTFYINGASVTGGSAGTLNQNNRIGHNTSGYFTGLIDEVRLYNRALSAGEVAYLYNKNAPQNRTTLNKQKTQPNDGLVGYWNFDGNNMNWGDSSNEATDASGQGNNGNVTNFGQSSVVAGVAGQALKFDNTNDVISMGASGLTGNITATWSAWIKTNSTVSNDYQSVAKIGDSAVALNAFSLFLNLAGAGVVSAEYAGGNGCATAAGVITPGQWYHVVATKAAGAVNTTTTIYVNGVAVACTGSALTPSVASGGSAIGSWPSNYFFDGLIDEVRLYNRALSAAEVKELYESAAPEFRSNTNVSQDTFMKEGLVGYWPFDGKYMNWGDSSNEATDASPSGNNGNISGFGQEGARPGIVGQALNFDGTNDYMTMGDKSQLSFADNIFTFSFWMKANNTTASLGVLGKRGSPWEYSIDSADAAGTLRMKVWSTSGSQVYGSGVNAGTYDTSWHFFTFVADGSNGYTYKDGVFQNSAAKNVGVDMSDTTSPFEIGRAGDSGGLKYTSGLLDEVRIYNRALSASEVLQLYNATKH